MLTVQVGSVVKGLEIFEMLLVKERLIVARMRGNDRAPDALSQKQAMLRNSRPSPIRTIPAVIRQRFGTALAEKFSVDDL